MHVLHRFSFRIKADSYTVVLVSLIAYCFIYSFFSHSFRRKREKSGDSSAGGRSTCKERTVISSGSSIHVGPTTSQSLLPSVHSSVSASQNQIQQHPVNRAALGANISSSQSMAVPGTPRPEHHNLDPGGMPLQHHQRPSVTTVMDPTGSGPVECSSVTSPMVSVGPSSGSPVGPPPGPMMGPVRLTSSQQPAQPQMAPHITQTSQSKMIINLSHLVIKVTKVFNFRCSKRTGFA